MSEEEAETKAGADTGQAPQTDDSDEAVRSAVRAAREAAEQEAGDGQSPGSASTPTKEQIKAVVSAAKAKLPRICEMLTNAGLRGLQLDARIVQLAAMPFDEEHLLRLLDDGPREIDSNATAPATHSIARRKWEVFRHSVVRWWHRKNAITRLVYLGAWSAALFAPSIHHGFTLWGTIGIVVVIAVALFSRWKDLDPDEIPIFNEHQRERQLSLETLISKSQRWRWHQPTGNEVTEFRVETLRLINSFVRDHRSDTKKKQIYTNLLVRRGAAVVVIARSDRFRRVPEIYSPEECSLAWTTLQTGVPQYTGNVYQTAPSTRKGKPYNSILVLPIKMGMRVVGAVSIDSEGFYHFDNVFKGLHEDLAPYVQLLAITLAEDHDTSGELEHVHGEQHGGDAGNSRPG